MLQGNQFAPSNPNQVPRVPSIAGAIDDFDRQIARLAEMIPSLRSAADKLHGGRPRDATVGAGAAKVSAGNLLGQLSERSAALSYLLGELGEEIERINGAL